MTLIVGMVCSDGVVMAFDRAAILGTGASTIDAATSQEDYQPFERNPVRFNEVCEYVPAGLGHNFGGAD